MHTQPPLRSRSKRRLSRSIRTVLPACAMAWVLLSGSHPAGAAPSIEVHPSLTPVSLAASPDVLVVGHLSGWSILENWQGNGPAPELVAAQSAPRGPAVGRDDTLYFPAYFELGSKPSQGTVSWMRNLPTALEAATVDDKGGLYVAARASVVIFPEGIPGPEVLVPTETTSNRIAVDPAGNVALGLFRSTGRFQVLMNPLANPTLHTYGPEHGLSDLLVTAIAVDGAGRFVVGTLSGLFVATGKLPNLSFVRLTTQHGLPSNSITALANDGRGGVAVGTPDGLVLWNGDLSTPGFLTLSKDDGLGHNSVISLASDGAGHVIAGHPGLFSVVTLEPGEDPLPDPDTVLLLGSDSGQSGTLLEIMPDNSLFRRKLITGDGLIGALVGLFEVSLDGVPSGATLSSLTIRLDTDGYGSGMEKISLSAIDLGGIPASEATYRRLKSAYASAEALHTGAGPGEALSFSFEGSALSALQSHLADAALCFRIDGSGAYLPFDAASIELELSYR